MQEEVLAAIVHLEKKRINLANFSTIYNIYKYKPKNTKSILYEKNKKEVKETIHKTIK